MDASFFIAGRLRFKGRIAMVSIAISYLVIIIAVSVSSGFRQEIRSGLSKLSGDVQLMPPTMNVLDAGHPIDEDASYMPYIREMDDVDAVLPVVYRAGIVKNGEDIHGIIIKGVPRDAGFISDAFPADSVRLPVSIPSRLAEISGLEPGDRMLTYFVGEDIKARQFNVVSVHEAMVETDDRLVVYADMEDMQRINGWNPGQVSSIEILLKDNDEEDIVRNAEEAGTLVNAYSSDDDPSVIAVSSVSSYPQLFDWLDLIDFNVLFILVLMTIVAGFNMISGLLIMLFENISTIGLLKSLGMTDKAISKVFLSSSAVLVLKGMAAGNILALVFCFIQNTTHVLRLDPENYFVSYVPVNPDLATILASDVASFVIIMLLLLIPCLFISKVDPAETVRVK
ncbi:MAG: ABC transporter permease [Bacteroidales bacterium]|nr:ABC transporter permease [Bacteroidales bacterium]